MYISLQISRKTETIQVHVSYKLCTYNLPVIFWISLQRISRRCVGGTQHLSPSLWCSPNEEQSYTFFDPHTQYPHNFHIHISLQCIMQPSCTKDAPNIENCTSTMNIAASQWDHQYCPEDLGMTLVQSLTYQLLVRWFIIVGARGKLPIY